MGVLMTHTVVMVKLNEFPHYARMAIMELLDDSVTWGDAEWTLVSRDTVMTVLRELVEDFSSANLPEDQVFLDDHREAMQMLELVADDTFVAIEG